ncbi:MAG: purine-nucleoside phosphorylase [Salinivirgaceae bacterium]|jgi:purine-nucleoside phosphorylase|nr:purine-nucleoside phosphorylase [Salinivirgaceae bacterium]
MLEKINAAAAYVQERISDKPQVGVILGSGLGNFGNRIANAVKIPYAEIPGFPVSTVEGHSGQLIFGDLGGKKVVAMQGRFHYYEGYEMNQVTLPVRVLKQLGVETLFVSNAAGGLNPSFNAGDMMIIHDHINFFPENALRGKNIDELGPRFPDMSEPYTNKLIVAAEKIATEESITLRKGVYVGSSGPTLETAAEYKMFRILGADATGMSTVPEVIVAVHMGMKVFGMSVITNVSEPADPDKGTTHDEVQDVAGTVEPQMTKIFTRLIEQL